MPQEGITHVGKAVDKLIDVSKVIQRRPGLKSTEEKRVTEAFTLLATGPPPVDSKGAKQREVYLDFLRRVQKVIGLSKVVLCAAGLGPSAISGMKDRVRVDLPFKMKERQNEFENGVLQSLADVYSAKTFPQIHHNNALGTPGQGIVGQPLLTGTSSEGTQIQGQGQATALTSLTGDVYELTIEDARGVVVMSDQIPGQIWLTDTYENTASFITIPISDELTNQFTTQRRRVM